MKLILCIDGRFFEGRDCPITMGRPEFNTSTNMNMVGLVVLIIRYLRRRGKTIITTSILCVIKGILFCFFDK